jgi:hypothetical protein
LRQQVHAVGRFAGLVIVVLRIHGVVVIQYLALSRGDLGCAAVATLVPPSRYSATVDHSEDNNDQDH